MQKQKQKRDTEEMADLLIARIKDEIIDELKAQKQGGGARIRKWLTI